MIAFKWGWFLLGSQNMLLFLFLFFFFFPFSEISCFLVACPVSSHLLVSFYTLNILPFVWVCVDRKLVTKHFELLLCQTSWFWFHFHFLFLFPFYGNGYFLKCLATSTIYFVFYSLVRFFPAYFGFEVFSVALVLLVEPLYCLENLFQWFCIIQEDMSQTKDKT